MLRIAKSSIVRLSSHSRCVSNVAPVKSSTTHETKTTQLITDEIKNSCNPIPVFKRALLYNKTTALRDRNGEFSYFDLYVGSKKLSSQISSFTENGSCVNVAYLCPNDVTNILSQWATWMSGQVAVPLSAAHPPELLEYFINDSQAQLLITTPELEAKIQPLAQKLGKPLITIDSSQLINEETRASDEQTLVSGLLDGQFYKKSPAMILYTSGTTNKPKGVVFSHSNLNAQVECLTSAWKVSASDTILHTLPLHHVHGLINALLLPLSVGGKVNMLPKFETADAWNYLLNVNLPQKDRITLFMGVPTIYNYLIQEYDKLFKNKSQMAEYIKTHCQNKIRLMISGSAPLPATVFQRWNEITGHKLLERYGMTEIGMAISNPLTEGTTKKRLPGFVGQPLPGVQIRITRPEDNNDVLLEACGETNKGFWSAEEGDACQTIKISPAVPDKTEIVGNLLVKGATVFQEYWKKPEATKSEFTKDGWFVTGDSVSYDPAANSFKILGRNSCDIIKTRGYKISALEMETKLLESPLIEDCAVIGMPDEVYGQKIVALVKQRNGTAEPDVEKDAAVAAVIEKWCVDKFASYSIPSIKIVEKVPRNQMGKVNKADLLKDLTSQQT